MANIFDLITGRDKKVSLSYLAGEDAEALELLKIDATRAEEHSFKAKATQHEVEDGANISDHVIKGGRVVTLDGVISDNPISIAAAAVGNLAGITGSLVEGIGGAVATGAVSKLGSELIANGSKPSKDAFDILEYIYEESIPLMITTSIKTYTNMIMESLTMPRNSKTANSLEFKASFKEARIVESEVVDIPPSSTTVDGAIEEQKGGKKPSVEPDAQTQGSGSTLLFKLQGAL
ncbi:MAG: hypothetical protein KAR42_15320 [candidate division Zixibacteria bacterium]|nr:hypothetical protein [candidate division Zixibacteria bacterium]